MHVRVEACRVSWHSRQQQPPASCSPLRRAKILPLGFPTGEVPCVRCARLRATLHGRTRLEAWRRATDGENQVASMHTDRNRVEKGPEAHPRRWRAQLHLDSAMARQSRGRRRGGLWDPGLHPGCSKRRPRHLLWASDFLGRLGFRGSPHNLFWQALERGGIWGFKRPPASGVGHALDDDTYALEGAELGHRRPLIGCVG